MPDIPHKPFVAWSGTGYTLMGMTTPDWEEIKEREAIMIVEAGIEPNEAHRLACECFIKEHGIERR